MEEEKEKKEEEEENGNTDDNTETKMKEIIENTELNNPVLPDKTIHGNKDSDDISGQLSLF